MPQLSIKNLPEVLLLQAFETNEIAPCGVMPIKTFYAVIWCLYDDNIYALASKFDGLSIKIWKQLMMTVTFFSKHCWKHWGMVCHNASRSSHLIKRGNLPSITIIQAWNVLETVEGQFRMSGVRIQVIENKLDLKLYSVLWSWQVTAHRKINSSPLVTTMYSGGVSKVSVYFFYDREWARGYILTCCIKLKKYEGLQTLVSEKNPN